MERARMSRQRRLRSASDFARVRQSGRAYSAAALVVTAARQLAEAGQEAAQPVVPTRVGLVVGRRVGDAVTRNRVRRRLRELVRQRLTDLAPGWDVVVGARATAAGCSYQALDQEFASLLVRAKVLAPGSEARSV